MNIQPINIIPITQARNRLGDLLNQAKGDDYIILTKGGVARTALVDLTYLTKLQAIVGKICQKTFIDPELLPFTREFTDKEIAEWEKVDRL